MMDKKLSVWSILTRMTSHMSHASLVLILTALMTCTAQNTDPCRPTNGQFEVFMKVSESAEIGDEVYAIVVPGNDATVALTSDYNEFFAFDSSTRKVIVNGTLDAETTQSSQTLTITCRVKDSGRRTSISINIAISDANDHGPEFPYDVFNVSVSEMTDIESVIPVERATDDDATPANNLVYYSILPGPYSDYFVFRDPLLPSLTLLKQLDYETLPQFSITVMAEDRPTSGSVKFNATCEVVIYVEDGDDQYPVFNASIYKGVIANSATINSRIPISPPIYAYDPDLTLQQKVIYSFHGGEFHYTHGQPFLPKPDVGLDFTSDESDHAHILSIDPDTAVVTLNSMPTADEVYLLIQATQVDNPSRYGVALLAVQVQGSNVNAPVFARDSYRVVVPEVFPVGDIITTVMASDKDPGSLITYSLDDPTDSFDIVSDTGDIMLAKELSYVAQPQHVIKVIASDGTLQSTATVTVLVRPVNNKPPTILNTNLNISSERRTGAIIVDIDAEDTDEGSVLSYRLLNYNNLFSISQSGVIKIISHPEDLYLNTYQITVVVSDGGLPSYEKAAVVEVNFPNISPIAQARIMEEDTILPIVMGVLAAVFLIIIIILIVYICRRRLQDKEHLDRVKRQPASHDPKALTFRQKQGTLGRQAKINIEFQEETSDGETTENPLSQANKGSYYNFGMINSSDTETETDANDIQVETSVAPFDPHSNDDNNNDHIYNDSQCSVDSEEYSHSEKNALTPFYGNGSLSTYRDSSGSDVSLNISPTASSDSKKALVPPGSLAQTRVPEENGGTWDRNASSVPSISNMPNLDPDASVVPTSQKQELTVYF